MKLILGSDRSQASLFPVSLEKAIDHDLDLCGLTCKKMGNLRMVLLKNRRIWQRKH